MNRRDLLVTGVGAGLAMIASTAEAQPKPPPAPAPKPDAKAALLAALQDCLSKAQACQAHCDAELANGNKSMAKCSQAVGDTLAVGWATHAVVARKSARAKKLVEVCQQICKDCSAACLEHKMHWEQHGMHLECKACMESCDACIKACAAFIAAK